MIIISSAVQMYFNDNNDNLNQLMKGGWLTSRSMEYYFLNMKKKRLLFICTFIYYAHLKSSRQKKKTKKNETKRDSTYSPFNNEL